MYSLTPTYDLNSIGQQIPRNTVKGGHVFKYNDGSFHYGNLGYIADNLNYDDEHFFSLKISRIDSPEAVTLTTTPTTSPKMHNEVVVKGYFSFNIKMHETPILTTIRDLVPYEDKKIKDVVTIKGFTKDTSNNTILFLLLGFKNPQEMYILRLTGDIDSIGYITTTPVNSIVAVRGEASLTITEGT